MGRKMVWGRGILRDHGQIFYSQFFKIIFLQNIHNILKNVEFSTFNFQKN